MNVGTVESADTTRKTFGGFERKAQIQGMQRMLTILTRRNQQMLNQKLKSVNSGWGLLDVDALQQQESEWIKIGVDTGAGKTAWPQSVTYGKKLPGLLTSLSAQRLESLSNVARDCTLKVVATIGVTSEFEGSSAGVNHCCLLESTRRWVESLLYGDKMLHVPQRIECCQESRCVDPPEGDEIHNTTVVQLLCKENNVYNIYMKPR